MDSKSSKNCITEEEQKCIDQKMESNKRQAPLAQSASNSDGKLPPVEMEQWRPNLDNFCSKMNLSEDILKDDKFMGALDSVQRAVNKHRAENPNDPVRLTYLNALVDAFGSNDGENLVNFAESLAKYKKKKTK